MLARYLVENLSSHNIWAFKMLITESIYFLNVFGNIYLMDVFLGGEFRTYGIQVGLSPILHCGSKFTPTNQAARIMLSVSIRWPA